MAFTIFALDSIVLASAAAGAGAAALGGAPCYVEGRDVAIEYRWAHNEPARLPGLVADLVNCPVTVIAAGDLPSALAAKAASTTIPIVFETAADPVQVGVGLFTIFTTLVNGSLILLGNPKIAFTIFALDSNFEKVLFPAKAEFVIEGVLRQGDVMLCKDCVSVEPRFRVSWLKGG